MSKLTMLEVIDITEGGSQQSVEKGDLVVMHYVGKLLENGKEFDNSHKRSQPFQCQIGIGQVIPGWDEGILGMKIGGKRTLNIPSEMAYGSNGAGADIPPNADLTFEVELLMALRPFK